MDCRIMSGNDNFLLVKGIEDVRSRNLRLGRPGADRGGFAALRLRAFGQRAWGPGALRGCNLSLVRRPWA